MSSLAGDSAVIGIFCFVSNYLFQDLVVYQTVYVHHTESIIPFQVRLQLHNHNVAHCVKLGYANKKLR